MKYLLSIFFVLTYISPLLSQENGENKEKIGLGIYLSPEINGLILQNKSSHQSTEPQFGFSIGAEMNFTFGKHFVLRSGIGFGYKQGRYINTDKIITQYLHPDIHVTVVNNATFQEVQFPLSLHYKFSKPIFIGAGMEFIIPSYFPDSGYLNGNNDDYHKTIPGSIMLDGRKIALCFSVGYRLKLVHSFYMLLEPSFRFYVKKIDIDWGTHSNFYSVGLKTTFWLGGK